MMAGQSWGCCGGGRSAESNSARQTDSVERSASSGIEDSGQTDSVRQADSASNCWNWCMGDERKGRRGGAGFGVFLIVVGLLWLGETAGWFRSEYVWPVAIVAFGLWITIISRIRLKKPKGGGQ